MTTTNVLTPPHFESVFHAFAAHLRAAARSRGLALDAGMAALMGGATYWIHTALDPHPLWAPACALLLAALLVAALGGVLGTAVERTRSWQRWWGLMRTVAHRDTGAAVVMDTDERDSLAGAWALIQPLHTNEPAAVWVPVRELARHDQTETEETS